MTANTTDFQLDERVETTTLEGAYAIERSAIESGVWPRLRRMADSAIKRRMSTEMADLAQQIRKIQYGDRT